MVLRHKQSTVGAQQFWRIAMRADYKTHSARNGAIALHCRVELPAEYTRHQFAAVGRQGE